MICHGRSLPRGCRRGPRLLAALAAAAILPASGCAVLDLPKDEPTPARSVVIHCDDLGDSPLQDATPRAELERICASLSPTPTATPPRS